jgi:predicted nucleic-acid-binding protein
VIGIDTNLLVRYVMQDDVKQSKIADKFFASLSEVSQEQGYLSVVVIVETVWVLESIFKLTHDQISQLLLQLLQSPELKIDHAVLVAKAAKLYQQGADFADALISLIADDAGCTNTATFDRDSAKKAGMVLVTELVRER